MPQCVKSIVSVGQRRCERVWSFHKLFACVDDVVLIDPLMTNTMRYGTEMLPTREFKINMLLPYIVEYTLSSVFLCRTSRSTPNHIVN